MGVATRTGARGIGMLIVLVGLWGGIVPFVGPTFGFSMGSTGAWTWTEGRGTLHVAPAIAAVVGGLILLASGGRGRQRLGGLLALVGGFWFVIGPSLQPLWATVAASGGGMTHMGGAMAGGSHTSTTNQALQAIGYHYGVGAVIAALAAFGLGLLARAASPDALPAAAAARRPRLSPRRVSPQP